MSCRNKGSFSTLSSLLNFIYVIGKMKYNYTSIIIANIIKRKPEIPYNMY